jgi:cytoskeletal protein RodZ
MTEQYEFAVVRQEDDPRQQALTRSATGRTARELKDKSVRQAAAGQAPSTPGQMLRMQREEAGLSLREVSETLYLTMYFLRLLENDEYDKLPGMTFVRGYFRSYASYLEMDVAKVMACYEKHVASRGLREHVHDFNRGPELCAIDKRKRPLKQKQPVSWSLVLGLCLIALAALGWLFGRGMNLDFDLSSRLTSSSSMAQLDTDIIPREQPTIE